MDHSISGERELVDLFSKLNPFAEEFVPISYKSSSVSNGGNSNVNTYNHNANGNGNRRGNRRSNERILTAQRQDSSKRTVYVPDIDLQVTEEQLAARFIKCGHVIDCRISGDPNLARRFAFVEFSDEYGARRALSLDRVRILPSKTAIVPVNPTILPKSADEREMCTRTIYCTNIDKKVSQEDVKLFFEEICGAVSRLRLFGDPVNSTRKAFVEFVMAESAKAALNCSGAVLGMWRIRVSPSKTPVRRRTPRS